MAILTKTDLASFRERLQNLRLRLRGDVKGIADGAFGREDGESRSPTHLAEPEKKSSIPKGRLKEIPWARNCVECQRKAEAHIF